MTDQTNLELKYLKAFPTFLLTCCALIFFSAFVTGFSMNTVTGLILLPIGILGLTQSIVTITPNEIQWKNMFGRTMKTFPYQAEDMEVKENKVFVGDEKILGLWMYDQSQDTIKQYFQHSVES